MKFFCDNTSWYKANLHAHTTVSDGRKSPEETEKLFREKGYQILAFSDHWKVSPAKVEKEFILLSAAELDTYYGDNKECFHIIGLNLPEGTTFPNPNKTVHPQKLIDRIEELGGSAFLAHPQWSLNQPEDIAALRNIFAVEVFNTTSGLPHNPDRADSSDLLDLVARKGYLIPQIATDDCHWYDGDECKSFTMIQTEDFSVEGIVKALRNGKFYASQGPLVKQVAVEDGRVTVTCSACVSAVFFSNSPWVSKRAEFSPEGATEYTYEIAKGDCFVRIELTDKDGNKAWISPFPVNDAINRFGQK